jgi:predicted metalloprotease with PDZ domain
VSGKAEIPWDDFLKYVGVKLVRSASISPDLGFEATRIFDAPPVIISIKTDSEAQRAGLDTGDSILEINHQIASSDFQDKLSALRPGAPLILRVRGLKGERELRWNVSAREQTELSFKDVDDITLQQRSRRAAWLKGEPEGAR